MKKFTEAEVKKMFEALAKLPPLKKTGVQWSGDLEQVRKYFNEKEKETK